MRIHGNKMVDKHFSDCVGLVLRDMRRYRSISGKDLAKAVGLSQQQISRYENGMSRISMNMLFTILLALDFSIENFMSKFEKQYFSKH